MPTIAQPAFYGGVTETVVGGYPGGLIGTNTLRAAPMMPFGATPMAAANVGGVVVAGADRNLDGIPDALEGLPA